MKKLFSLLILLSYLSLGNSAAETQNQVVQTAHTKVSLISEMDSIQPGKPFWLALELNPTEGWHTYWLNPGDSGMPTTVKWHLPKGFSAGAIQWPIPKRIAVGPLMNYGYKKPIHLLTEITPPDNLAENASVEISANARWLVCEEVCIPEKAQLGLSLPVKSEPQIINNALTNARNNLAQHAPWNIEFSIKDGYLWLYLPLSKQEQSLIKKPTFFPITKNLIENISEQTLFLTDTGIALRIKQSEDFEEPNLIDGLLVTTNENSTDSFYFSAKTATAPLKINGPASNSSIDWIKVLQALLFAFIGGLILNLMPCVFPVLSLKALAIVDHAHHDQQQTRLEGTAFTIGVLISFALIGGALLALRAAGSQIGWGFQLQSPVFVALLALVLFIVGLNLSGVFTISSRFSGIGQNLAEKNGLSGAFFTGVLATIVATPCTAPFMASAMGLAITLPSLLAMLIFMMLGFGLAFPYLAISFSPKLQTYLPKPGNWMVTLKEILAFPMYASSAWLIWVLGQQANINTVAGILFSMVLLGLAAWAYERSTTQTNLAKKIALLTSLIALIMASALLYIQLSGDIKQNQQNTSQNYNSGLTWEVFSEERLADLRKHNKPVFINHTAAWCITCLVNERVALTSDEVAEKFKAKDITYLKGDWTNNDPEITRFLQSFNRSGVPLYVLYPANGEPIVLPQVLTPDIILDAIDSIQ